MQFQKAISIAEEKRQKAKAKKLQEEALLLAEMRRESILAGNANASAYAGQDGPLESSSDAGIYAGGTSEGSAFQRAIVSYALQFVGNPYVWGGESLINGCDCSGFVMKVYEKYGYSLPHYSGSQAKCGTAVSLTDLEPGDLVFYLHSGRIGHVAMYIGDGKIVHAKSRRDGIVITDVNYATPYCAVRMV